MRWWPPKKLKLPESENGGVKHSAEILQESEKKLRDAVKDRREVKKVNDMFAESLERAMRRSHG